MQSRIQEKDVKDIPDIRTAHRHSCYLCGETGRVIYTDLRDRLYDVPGVWSLRQCLNESCRLTWLDPVPIEEDIGKAYTTYFTHSNDFNTSLFRLRQRLKKGLLGLRCGYKTTLLDQFLAFPLLFAPFLSKQVITTVCTHLLPKRTGRLLEIGFGNGTLLQSLHELGWEVEGVDFDPLAVEAVQQNFNLKVRAGSLEDQLYPDSYFEAVVMSHVIEHVHDPGALLTECRRVLKPGGKVILLTPNIESLGYQTFGADWLHLDPPRHLHLFSPTTLRRLGEKSGLTIKQLKTNARDAHNTWIMSRNIQHTGKCRSVNRTSVLPKLQSNIFQLKEHLALIKSSSVGDELVMVATK